MSYIVPRDKPIECHGCPFCDIYTHDCRLQKVQYETFDEQIQTCPLVSCNDRDNKVNLCDSCRNHFADCEASNVDVIFGDGNDNVCACAKYRPWYAPKSGFAPEGDTPWKRLNCLVFDINPTEIANKILYGNLHDWCRTMRIEMGKCLTAMKVDEEELR